MSHEDDFQKLIDAIWAERDQGRGVRRALAEHPDLWPLVVELGLDGFAQDDDCDHDAHDEVPVFAGSVAHRPGVEAWSGRAAID